MKMNSVFAKLRDDKGARAIAITVVAMFLVLTAIIITTVIANRRAKENEPPFDASTALDSEDKGGDVNVGAETDPPEKEPDDGKENDKDNNANADVLPSHFLLPVSGVLQKKHSADMQVFSDTMGDYRIHLGIDIGTTAGANVAAMADGVIAEVWEDVSMGQCVAIAHGGDSYTIYKNLSTELPENVIVGKSVKTGDVIGTVGDSAMVEIADEPHLHLEMTVNGLQVSPTDYLDEDALATLNEDTNYEDVS